MGLSLLTPTRMHLRSVGSKELLTYTITLLRSLADPGGGFDVPSAKCPPDRGSPDCVTGSPASVFSASPSSSSNCSTPQSSPELGFSRHTGGYPLTPVYSGGSLDSILRPPSISAPRNIPTQKANFHNLATPPLTPDDSPTGSGSVADTSNKQDDSALDFLLTLFPRGGLTALPFAKSVSISSPELRASFKGVVLELPGKPKTLYVNSNGAENIQLRDSIVALLDLAGEHLHCEALVIALERSSPSLGELLHSLMYVGGAVVTKPPFPIASAFVLVGLEV